MVSDRAGSRQILSRIKSPGPRLLELNCALSAPFGPDCERAMPGAMARRTADRSWQAAGVERHPLPARARVLTSRRVGIGTAAGMGIRNLNYETSWNAT